MDITDKATDPSQPTIRVGQAERPVLVSDLDGSLIASDMLYETFWSACARNWTTPFAAMRSLGAGKTVLKADLVGRSDVDVTTLPYNAEVITLLTDWRASGGRTALVTASDQQLAERVAAHLGLFDEVHGSGGKLNLKGPEKAAFLGERFSREGFDYIGDSRADLPVWANARRAITVGIPQALRSRVEQDAGPNRPAIHIDFRKGGLRPMLKAVRPHQWLKNLLVFLPMLMAHDFSSAAFLSSLLAFVAFSLVASSVYVLNDLLDLGADRVHPRKRNRPFASGALRIQAGTWMVPLLLVLGMGLAAATGPGFLGILAIYYVLTLAYSLDLKRRTIVDICTLAVLYTLRVVAGGAATGIMLSVWLLAFAMFFFFALAAVKRQAELVDGLRSGKVRAQGRSYMVEDLPVISMLATASGFVSVLVMALYVTADHVTIYYSAPEMLWGICLVLLYWISRIVMMTHRGHMHDDPVIFAVKDRNSQICGMLIVALALGGTML